MNNEIAVRWEAYLAGLSNDARITKKQCDAARAVWKQISERVPNAAFPTSGFEEYGSALYFSWSPRGRTLELEIDHHGEYGWFFANHVTGAKDYSGCETDILEDSFFGYVPHQIRS